MATISASQPSRTSQNPMTSHTGASRGPARGRTYSERRGVQKPGALMQGDEKGSKVPDKRRVWKEIFDEGRSPPSYEKWTEEDEERLMASSKSELTFADTQFRRAIATKKRELEASVDFMRREERDRMIRKLIELNEEEALATATGVEEEHHTGELGQMDGV